MNRLSIVLVTSVGCGACGLQTEGIDDQATFLTEKEIPIINGDTVTRGSLADLGVVRLLNGCTGTLLTNQHVLTAAHCANGVTPDVRLEGANSGLDQTIATADVFVSPTYPGDQTDDYAVIELDVPLVVDGEDDEFSNVIYQAADSTLVGETVFCAGYGNNVEETWAGASATGGGTLRSASIDVFSASGGLLRLERTNDQLQHAGDSGSTCFLNGFVVGVHSNGTTEASDLDSDGFVDRLYANQASPGAYRTFAQGITLANVEVSLRLVPALGGTVEITGSTPRGSWDVDVADGGSATRTNGGLRSGRLTLTADEPTRTMCEKVTTRTPLAGTAEVTVTCLGDGLVSVLL